MERRPEEASSSGSTTVVTEQAGAADGAPALVLHLRPAEADAAPRVRWAEDTVDNELLGKKKSKCCCIFKKQKRWDEGSDQSEDECETGHCHGHVEKKSK